MALTTAAHGAVHDRTAVVASNLGGVLGAAGRHAEALEAYDRALAIRLELLGPDHVSVARTRTNRGVTLGRLGRYAEAVDELRAATDVFARVHGPDHESVGMSLANLGPQLASLGDLDEALRTTTRAVTILDARGRPSPHLPAALGSQGYVLAALGRVAEARRAYERALAHAPAPDVADALREELDRIAAQGDQG